MTWSDIIKLRGWTSLSEVNCTPELVMDGIYKIGEYAYVKTQPHNKKFEEGDPRAPFITKAYWSPTLEGLKKLILGDPSVQILGSLPSPPVEITHGTSGFYCELSKYNTVVGKSNSERGIYSSQGVFLYKIINIELFNYYFISNVDENERTFLIDVALAP